jgi:hypothetical protein
LQTVEEDNLAGYLFTLGFLGMFWLLLMLLLLACVLQGHMVPMDQPAAALDMITRFVRHKDLSGHEAITMPESPQSEQQQVGQQVKERQQQKQKVEQPAGLSDERIQVS